MVDNLRQISHKMILNEKVRYYNCRYFSGLEFSNKFYIYPSSYVKVLKRQAAQKKVNYASYPCLVCISVNRSLDGLLFASRLALIQ